MHRLHFLALSLFALSLPAACSPQAQAKAYPLDTCIVSGEKLGGMGKPFVFEYQGQEVQLCCKSCKAKFESDAEAMLKKIATAAQK